MSASFAHWDDRTLALAADLATEGLDARRRAELDRRARPEDLEDFELAVAAVHLAVLDGLETPPPGVLDRLHASAGERFAPRRRPGPLRHPALGWLAAATVLCVTAFLGSGARSPERGRAALLARGAAAPLAWSGTGDALAAGVEGDVVWSDADQEGYLRFEGLAANDPGRAQYQLWIFDATRPDSNARPVDGGVFDVRSDGEVVLPIDPALPIGEATLFAVTLERPGGVVVPSRERLLLLARARP